MPEVRFRATDPLVVPGRGVSLPGTDSIGMGYDVFGGVYASPEATTVQLFDLGPHEPIEIPEGAYLKPQAVLVQGLQKSGITRTEGTTSRDYQADRALKAGLEGDYGFFSGSLDAEFTSAERRCTTYCFVSQTERFYKYLLSLPPGDAVLDRVLPDVRDDLDGMPAERLFEKYGTHYLRSLIIGATSIYSSAVNTFKYTSTIEAKLALELQYKALTSSLVKLSAEQAKAVSELASSSHLEIFVQGGRAERAHAILDGSYQPWIDSIGETMAFVGLNPNSLQPVWLLCAGRRRDELEAAYLEFGKAHPAEGAPDIIPIHHYSSSVEYSRHYHSRHKDDFPGPDWQLADGQVTFYAFSEPAEDRIPIYVHESLNRPRRFRLSPDQKIGHGWGDSSTIAFHAWKDRRDGCVAVFGFTADAGKESAYHGWLYTTADRVKGWIRQGTAFYVPAVK
jgi:hypothetical protein